MFCLVWSEPHQNLLCYQKTSPKSLYSTQLIENSHSSRAGGAPTHGAGWCSVCPAEILMAGV